MQEAEGRADEAEDKVRINFSIAIVYPLALLALGTSIVLSILGSLTPISLASVERNGNDGRKSVLSRGTVTHGRPIDSV